MKCFKPDCPAKAPHQTLFRVNAKGVEGIWACADHRLETDRELDEIVNVLENMTSAMRQMAERRQRLKRMLKMAELLRQRHGPDPTIEAAIAKIKVDLLYLKLELNAWY